MQSIFIKNRSRDLKGQFSKLDSPSGFDKKKYLKEYYQKNKEKKKLCSIAWNRNNKEKRKIIKQRWSSKNKERINYHSK